MKHRYTAIALPIIVCGAAAAGATNASARDIPETGTPPVVVPGPTVEVPVDDAVAEGLQTAAGALGGAGLAFGGLWLYRRRQPLAAH